MTKNILLRLSNNDLLEYKKWQLLNKIDLQKKIILIHNRDSAFLDQNNYYHSYRDAPIYSIV